MRRVPVDIEWNSVSLFDLSNYSAAIMPPAPRGDIGLWSKPASRPQPRATSAMTTVWNNAYAVAAVTAAVPPKLLVAMTSATPTFRTAVVIASVLRLALPDGDNNHPAARPEITSASIPRYPTSR